MISKADKEVSRCDPQGGEITSGEIFCVVARQSERVPPRSLAWACRHRAPVPAPLIYFTLWPPP